MEVSALAMAKQPVLASSAIGTIGTKNKEKIKKTIRRSEPSFQLLRHSIGESQEFSVHRRDSSGVYLDSIRKTVPPKEPFRRGGGLARSGGGSWPVGWGVFGLKGQQANSWKQPTKPFSVTK